MKTYVAGNTITINGVEYNSSTNREIPQSVVDSLTPEQKEKFDADIANGDIKVLEVPDSI